MSREIIKKAIEKLQKLLTKAKNKRLAIAQCIVWPNKRVW